MEIAHLECPSCQQPIELPLEDARRGLCCPACFKFFTPDLPAPVRAASDREIEADRLITFRKTEIRNIASRFSTAAITLLLVGLLILLIGGLITLSGDTFFPGWILAGSLIGAAFWLFLIAQIIHIRANTEK